MGQSSEASQPIGTGLGVGGRMGGVTVGGTGRGVGYSARGGEDGVIGSATG